MAFRRFSEAAPMRAAQFEGLPNLIGAVQTAGIVKAKKEAAAAKSQQELQKRVDAYKFSAETDMLPQDIEPFNEEGLNLGKGYLNALYAGETGFKERGAMDQHEMKHAKLRSQRDQITVLNKTIDERAKNDPYYIGPADEAKVMNVAIMDAGPERDAAIRDLSLGGDETFNDVKQRADYVASVTEKWSKKTTDASGKVVDVEINEAFLDEKGNTIVTPVDADQYLNSHVGVKPFYTGLIVGEVEKTAQEMIDNPVLYPWAKDMELNNLTDHLLKNPNDNFKNKRTLGERQIMMAQHDLREAIKTNRQMSSTAAAKDMGKDKVETRMSATTDSRYETLGNAVFEEDEAALQTVFGGVKGVKEVKFDYAKQAFPAKDKKTVIKVNIPVEDEDNWVEFPFGTLEEKKSAIIKLNKYMDDEVKGTDNYVGGDRILRLMEKDPRFNPDKRPKAEY